MLLWRALVDESAMPPGVALPADGEPSREMYAGPYRLVTYLVPGPAGETAVGHRRLNMVWYDPQQRELLHEAGAPRRRDGPRQPRARCAAGRGEEAAGRLRVGQLAEPVARSAGLALETGAVFGTPIVHYRPARLVNGRVALAGDAAHAASPMVGAESAQGLYDVRALSETMGGITTPLRSRARSFATSGCDSARRLPTYLEASGPRPPTWPKPARERP